MASRTRWKVYDDSDRLIASVVWPSDAAVLLVNYPQGRVRIDGRIVYRVDRDGPTGESYDLAVNLMLKRHDQHRWAYLVKMVGEDEAREIYADAKVKVPA